MFFVGYVSDVGLIIVYVYIQIDYMVVFQWQICYWVVWGVFCLSVMVEQWKVVDGDGMIVNVLVVGEEIVKFQVVIRVCNEVCWVSVFDVLISCDFFFYGVVKFFQIVEISKLYQVYFLVVSSVIECIMDNVVEFGSCQVSVGGEVWNLVQYISVNWNWVVVFVLQVDDIIVVVVVVGILQCIFVFFFLVQYVLVFFKVVLEVGFVFVDVKFDVDCFIGCKVFVVVGFMDKVDLVVLFGWCYLVGIVIMVVGDCIWVEELDEVFIFDISCLDVVFGVGGRDL